MVNLFLSVICSMFLGPTLTWAKHERNISPAPLQRVQQWPTARQDSCHHGCTCKAKRPWRYLLDIGQSQGSSPVPDLDGNFIRNPNRFEGKDRIRSWFFVFIPLEQSSARVQPLWCHEPNKSQTRVLWSSTWRAVSLPLVCSAKTCHFSQWLDKLRKLNHILMRSCR